ncbi:MAG TPA: DoxX family protein [Rhizomicrobium sp.]|jgi:putative oxidoreductase
MGWLSKHESTLLSVLRIVAGLLLLEHGTQKLFHFPPMTMALPADAMPIIMVAAVIELVGGMLLVLGVFTRITAFICSGEMAVAYWIGHFPRGGFFPAVNGGDAAILFCFIFLYIAAAGPGPIALVRSDKL